ncbi:MAG: alkaline phosphatase [Chitinophagaceae bacterium]|nr:alkaline phosphatase [Chitinophagaceae bacterium]
MYKLFLSLCLLSCASINAQPRVYTTANAHSHNDYEKPVPFHDAYKHQFGSIEADIFLLNGSDELYVAHYKSDLDKKRRTLDSLYLLPLVNCIRKNNGFVYADTSRKLQLMIDIKTEAVPTLTRLITQLRKYPELINSPTLQVVISGNRPIADSFYLYPPFIQFDGILGTAYSKIALSRIAMLSAPFAQFSRWNGIETIPEKQRIELAKFIVQAHEVNKPVRLWGAPDTIDGWKEFMRLQVDYINTDHIRELSEFLKHLH